MLSASSIAIAGTSLATYSAPAKPATGLSLSHAEIDQSLSFLRSHPVIDVHAHPGRSFMVGIELDPALAQVILPGGFEQQRITGMKNYGIDTVLSAIVSDLKVLGFAGEGIVSTRDFNPGEAYEDFLRQLNHLKKTVANSSLTQVTTAAEIRAAHDAQMPSFMFASEGGDFIEDNLDRIAMAHKEGIRVIGPVHYHTNDFGDIQTAPAKHGGLTPLGAEAVREMNHQGILIDVAHASEPTVNGILEASSKPIMLSHSHIAGKIQSARFVSLALAQRIAEQDGIIGAWPAGIGAKTLGDFVNRVLELVDAVGAEHVAIGTDLDANYKPVLTEYADFVALTGGLRQQGVKDVDLAAILGGNFLRVLAASEVV